MSQPASGDPTSQPDGPAAAGTPSTPPPHPTTAFPTPGTPSTPPPHPTTAFPTPGAAQPPNQQPPVPRRRRGVLIASIALAVTLLLCLGGGIAAFLAVGTVEDGVGSEGPQAAVEEFLTAVYQDRDAAQASSLVCSAAQDQDKISAKVAEVEKYAADYKRPHFRWSPLKVDEETEDRAIITTTVTMTTADEKVADLPLRLTVVKTTGWRVCEVAGG